MLPRLNFVSWLSFLLSHLDPTRQTHVSGMEPPPIRACLFDMDGLLLNTEDLITTCINVILRKYGKEDLPWSVKARMQGRTAQESNSILQQWAQLPIDQAEFKSQVDVLHQQTFPTSEPLPGVPALLQRLNHAPDISLALATSSTDAKFEMKSSRCSNLFECFSQDCRVMGDDPRVAHHKPAPDIYLCALQCVNNKRAEGSGQTSISAGQCLVFEDSVQGVDAGRRAGMQVVWCPHSGLLHEVLQGDIENNAVEEDIRKVFGLSSNTQLRGLEVSAFADRISEATGGWVRLLTTLESFPYSHYGLVQ
jgi:pseudouridine-5'-monophosphatase